MTHPDPQHISSAAPPGGGPGGPPQAPAASQPSQPSQPSQASQASRTSLNPPLIPSDPPVPRQLPRLQVSENRRSLVTEDGKPFFWLGDTAWELFHRLSLEEADDYLRIRAEQRFNVIQAVLLAELEGITAGNAYGRLPLLPGDDGTPDPLRPDLKGPYSYWDHVDAVLELAGQKGMYLALLPAWGDKFNRMWGEGPEIFTPERARAYGEWLGRRYAEHSHLVWVLGGDRPLSTSRHFQIIEGMAEGLKAGGARQLMTFHPKGAESSSYHLHDAPWLDFNMIQSGHGEREITNYDRVRLDYERLPVKPTLDAEPCYEDIPIGFRAENGYFDEADVRRAAYYAVLSGALGHTYGHHSVWPMADGMYASAALKEPGDFIIMSWREALQRPGARQMRHLRALFEPYWGSGLRPVQQIIARNRPGANYMTAAQTDTTAFIYCPNGLYVDAAMGYIEGEEAIISWYCPREGRVVRKERAGNAGILRFTAPTSGRGCDWVLIMEGAEACTRS